MPEQQHEFGGTHPVRVQVDLDKYVDQRVDALLSERENKVWRALWKWFLLAGGGGGAVGFLLDRLFS